MNFQSLFQKISEKDLLEGSWLITGIDEKEKFSSILEISLNNALEQDIIVVSREEIQDISPKVRILEPSIGNIRKVIHFLNLSPSKLNSKKIVIFNRAEELNSESQNALLKTVEEPSINSVLFFLIKDETRIFSTLVSRMKTIKFPLKDYKEYFKSRILKQEKEFILKKGTYLQDILLKDDAEKVNFAGNLVILLRDQLLNSLSLNELKITNIKGNSDIKSIKQGLKIYNRLKNPSINHKLQLESLVFRI